MTPRMETWIPWTGIRLWPLLLVAGFGLLLTILCLCLMGRLSGRKSRIAVILAACLGIVMAAVPSVLVLDNYIEGLQAEKHSELLVEELRERVAEKTRRELAREDAAPGEWKLESIDGHDCIGILSLPDLGLELPVLSQWSYENLRLAPCRYSGSPDEGNFILLAHNYERHFGQLQKLSRGAAIFFTDNRKQRTGYSVDKVEILNPYELERLTGSDYDLTLFTCTYGGYSRVVVRGNRLEDGNGD